MLLPTNLRVFFHEHERYTIVSDGHIWAHDIKDIDTRCIIPLLDQSYLLNWAPQPVYGICSDLLAYILKELNMSILDVSSFVSYILYLFYLLDGYADLVQLLLQTLLSRVVALVPILVLPSLAGTELGLITVMYNAQKGVTSGLAALHIGLIAGIVTLCIGLTGFIVVPLRRLKVLTIPEFYEHRFDRQTRILGAVIMVIGGVLNMGLFLKVAALFVASILGISITGWPLLTIMTILLILVLLYTLFGGMVSVIITDFIQFILLSIGLGIMLFTYFNHWLA